MEGLPLHPAIVHIPLGLAVVMPLLAAAAALSIWKGWVDKKVWIAVVVVQALIFGGALVAKETGEDQEEIVEKVVSEDAIHEHEEEAEGFIVVAGVTLAASAAALFIPAETAVVALMGATVLLSVVVTGVGLSVGHSGGELVYVHGAAKAYEGRVKPGRSMGPPGLERAYEKEENEEGEHE